MMRDSKSFKAMAICLFLTQVSACVSMPQQGVARADFEASSDCSVLRDEVGKKFWLETTRDVQIEIRLLDCDAGHLIYQRNNSKQVERIAKADVESLRQKKDNLARTLGVVVLGLLVAYGAAQAKATGDIINTHP